MDALEVWRAFSRLSKEWYRQAERNLEPLGLSVLEVRALRALSEAGPSPMFAVARELAVTQAAITGIIDRLERAGLVTRVRQTRDRRVIHVRITSRGERTLGTAIRRHRDFVRETLRVLTPREAVDLESALARLGDSLARVAPTEGERIAHQALRTRR